MQATDYSQVDTFKSQAKVVVEEIKNLVNQVGANANIPSRDSISEMLLKMKWLKDNSAGVSRDNTQNLSLIKINYVAELSTNLGDKFNRQMNPKLLPIFLIFLEEILDMMEDLLESIFDSNKTAQLVNKFEPILKRRLEWLKKKDAEFNLFSE